MAKRQVKKPTLKELQSEAERLGITPQSAGGPIAELIELVRDSDDPLAELALYAPAADPGDGQPLEADDPDAAVPPDPPTAEETEPGDSPESPQPSEADEFMPGVRVVSIDVPLSAVDPAAHLGANLDVRLSQAQATGCRAIQNALLKAHVVLANGRQVATMDDAVCWLLEQVDEKI